MARRLELLGELTPAIWIHLIAALLALVIGAFVLWRRKGDRTHRLLGRGWVAIMVVVAVSSLFISEIKLWGYFSPIHILSVVSLISLWVGVSAMRNRTPENAGSALSRHRNTMQGLYAYGMLIAGGFTFMPERLLGRLTFGETMPMVNYGLVGILVSVGLVLVVRAYGPERGLRRTEASPSP